MGQTFRFAACFFLLSPRPPARVISLQLLWHAFCCYYVYIVQSTKRANCASHNRMGAAFGYLWRCPASLSVVPQSCGLLPVFPLACVTRMVVCCSLWPTGCLRLPKNGSCWLASFGGLRNVRSNSKDD